MSAPPSRSPPMREEAARLSLPAHVHAVAIGEDIVFLDILQDAYLCLVGAARAVRLTPEGLVEPVATEIADTLMQAGLVVGAAPAPRRPTPPKATEALPSGRRRAGPRDLAAASSACIVAAAAFRFKSFAGLVATVADRQQFGAATPPPEAVFEAAAVFARLRPWSPVGGRCLMRSYLQLRFLRRLGLDADWVIGVRTWPFMAHCWLQVGSVALDEDVERLVAYTPLMVI